MDTDLKQYLEAMEGRLIEHFNTTVKGLENSLEGLENRVVELGSGFEGRFVEAMGDMQTELLRVFAAASEDETIPLRKM